MPTKTKPQLTLGIQVHNRSQHNIQIMWHQFNTKPMNFPPKTITQMERISKTYNLFLVIRHLFQSYLRHPQQFYLHTVLLKGHHRTYTPKGLQNDDTHTTWACSRDNIHTTDCSNKDDVCPGQNCSGNDTRLVLETEAT